MHGRKSCRYPFRPGIRKDCNENLVRRKVTTRGDEREQDFLAHFDLIFPDKASTFMIQEN